MTKKKTTKHALLMSILSLMMCVSMLVGTTFAWFTDEVTSSGNIIKSGTLDVTMEWKDATATGVQQEYKDASEGAIFNSELWEPGYVEAKNIKIGNAGTLALKYQLNIIATGEVSELADVIDVYYAEGEYILADRNMSELTNIGTLTEVLAQLSSSANGDLLAGESDIVTLALKMQESAGNKYQDKAIGSEFAVQLMATQLTYEEDSFGTDYDDITLVSNADELKAAVEAGGNVMLAKDIEVVDITSTVAKNVTANLYLNGKTISATSTIADRNADGTINSHDNYNVFLVQQGGTLNIIGDGEINVVHIGDNMNWDAMTTVAHAYGDITVSNGAVLSNLGGTSMAFALNVYSGGDITVEDSFLGATYCAMRAFNAQAGAMSVIDVKNSSLVSYNWNRAFWAQYDKDLTVYGVLTEVGAAEAGNTIYGSVRHAGMSDSALWVGGEKGDYPVIVGSTSELQAALDKAYTGMTIQLAAGVEYGAVEIRPTANNETTMYCETHGYTTEDAAEFISHVGDGSWHTTPVYTTEIKDVTVIGADGATVAGLTATSGHIYGNKYDYVRNYEKTEGSVYYCTLNISNLSFKNVAFTGQVNLNTSDATSVYDGVTFDGCSFTTEGTASANGAAIRYYNEANDGRVKNISLKDCSFNNCYQGVYVHHVNGVTVTGCTFDTIGHNAIALQGHDGAVALKEVVITGNTFTNVTNRVIRFNEIAADSNITIQNNTAINSGDNDGQVMKATSIADGVVTSISNNNWNGGIVANEVLQDK